MVFVIETDDGLITRLQSYVPYPPHGIGEFAGIPATGTDVRVPLCVVYDLENEQIKRGRVYFEMPALLRQLGVPMG